MAVARVATAMAVGGHGNGSGAESAGAGGHAGSSAGGYGEAEANGHGSGGHAGSAQAGSGYAGTAHGSASTRHTGRAGHASLASALGALNAAHASPTVLAHAAPKSRVGMIAAYDGGMLEALAMPAATPAQIAARNAAIAAARQDQLAAAANKGLTPAVVSHVDVLLGLPPSNPALGVTPSDVDAANAWRCRLYRYPNRPSWQNGPFAMAAADMAIQVSGDGNVRNWLTQRQSRLVLRLTAGLVAP